MRRGFRYSRRVTSSRLLAFLLALPLLALAASAQASGTRRSAEALGHWQTAGATLTFVLEDGVVVGRLATRGGPCPVAPGTELLRGTLLDDSLSARVRLCLVSSACGDDPESALAVLLLTTVLTGGVHTQKPCAREVRSLVLRRSDVPQALRAPPLPGERLSKSVAPRSPRKIPARGQAAAREVARRPVGEDQAGRYDPRAAGVVERQLRLGQELLAAGRFERARRAFRKALREDPQRVEAYNGVGVSFYARGDLDEALAWYKRALEVDPRFGDAYYNLACAYALRGDQELALRYLRLAALNHYAEVEQLRDDPDLQLLQETAEMREIVALMDAKRAPAGGRP